MEDKKVNDFIITLDDKIKSELAVRDADNGDVITHAKNAILIFRANILSLKEFIAKHNFKSVAAEINFFKIQKPKLISRLIYYHLIYNIESHKPVGYPLLLKQYYENEIRKINSFYDNNREFYLYYKSDNGVLDNFYFVRNKTTEVSFFASDEVAPDPDFTTVYDYKLATIIAYEEITDYITSIIAGINNNSTDETVNPNKQTDRQLTWTASKVSLVELLYALQSAGSCNNGNIDLKHLANIMEKVFNVDLGNYYRVFQEMRIRKINRTTYLDLLKNRLIQRMDETDENPKF